MPLFQIQLLEIANRTTIGGMLSGNLEHTFKIVTVQATFLPG